MLVKVIHWFISCQPLNLKIHFPVLEYLIRPILETCCPMLVLLVKTNAGNVIFQCWTFLWIVSPHCQYHFHWYFYYCYPNFHCGLIVWCTGTFWKYISLRFIYQFWRSNHFELFIKHQSHGKLWKNKKISFTWIVAWFFFFLYLFFFVCLFLFIVIFLISGV